jgi:cytochrome c2
LVIGAFLLGACLRTTPLQTRAGGCLACHAPHHETLGACTACHRGDPGAARKELAHARLLTGRAADHVDETSAAVREGARLAEAAACRRCHTIAGTGNRLAADLDAVVAGREQGEIVSSVERPVENMPDFGFERRQAESLVAFLLHHAREETDAPPYRVRFQRSPAAAGSGTFDRNCGPCHRMLGREGPRGAGNAGPNLSGLLTSWYPPTAEGGRAWNETALRQWLQNPRAVRAATTMPPVPLEAHELAAILEELEPPATAGPSPP